MSSRSKSAENRVRYELEKRGLPTFGSPERCRARLDRHLEAERKPAKKHIRFDDETPVANLTISFHDANGRAFPIRRRPVMNPEEDIDWEMEDAHGDAEMEEINEAAERDAADIINNIPEIARDALNEAFVNDQEEVVIRPENEAAGIAAWQNFVQEQQINGATDFYRQYIGARIRGDADVLERFLTWHEYEDSLFVHQNGFANPREN